MRNFKIELESVDEVIEAEDWEDAFSRAVVMIQDMLEVYEFD